MTVPFLAWFRRIVVCATVLQAQSGPVFAQSTSNPPVIVAVTNPTPSASNVVAVIADTNVASRQAKLPGTIATNVPMIRSRTNVAVIEQFEPNSPEEFWKREYAPSHDRRIKWWREARFGMFIHWGIYSVPAGVYKGGQSRQLGEWLMRNHNIPVAEYAAYAKEFNPIKFDADEWVTLAKSAGMKYIVITAKHHDGFAMYRSKVSTYNIYDATPFKRDPIRELADACRKHGIKFGIYYSQAQDWYHPGGAAANRNTSRNIDRQNHWDPVQQGSMDDYIDKIAVPQVRELLAGYGPIAVLWWDTPIAMTPQRAAKFLPLLKAQPKIITNNRLDAKRLTGDFETPEQRIPANGIPGKDWETCMTMNTTWGYKSFDNRWKSTERIITNLVEIVSKGGNFLLNVGPTAEGLIPDPSVERLQEVGEWLEVNGDAIYGTSASPFSEAFAWGRCTRKTTWVGTKLYLHVFHWPSDGILKVPGLKNEIRSATLLATGKKVAVEKRGDVVLIRVPEKALDEISTTIVLNIKGEPDTGPPQSPKTQ